MDKIDDEHINRLAVLAQPRTTHPIVMSPFATALQRAFALYHSIKQPGPLNSSLKNADEKVSSFHAAQESDSISPG